MNYGGGVLCVCVCVLTINFVIHVIKCERSVPSPLAPVTSFVFPYFFRCLLVRLSMLYVKHIWRSFFLGRRTPASGHSYAGQDPRTGGP